MSYTKQCLSYSNGKSKMQNSISNVCYPLCKQRSHVRACVCVRARTPRVFVKETLKHVALTACQERLEWLGDQEGRNTFHPTPSTSFDFCTMDRLINSNK